MARTGYTHQNLPDTLAQRVQYVRENLGLTQGKLAEVANMPVSQIQDIEAGIELFLSPAVRQKLARALKLQPRLLKGVEKEPARPKPPLSQEAKDRYIEEILHHPNETYYCPECQNPLITRLFQRQDLEENRLLEVKATCSKCLFKI